MNNIKEIIKEYKKIIDEELKIDKLNIEDVQLKLPARKHFWVNKLINYKIELNEYKIKLNEAIEKVTNHIIENSDIKFTKQEAIKLAHSNSVIIEIKNRISELEILIEYLEKVEKIYSSVSYDIANIINLMKQEMM